MRASSISTLHVVVLGSLAAAEQCHRYATPPPPRNTPCTTLAAPNTRANRMSFHAGGEKGGDIALAGVERFLLLEPGAALVLANLSVTGVHGPARQRVCMPMPQCAGHAAA